MALIPVVPIIPSPNTGWGTTSGIVPASGLETALTGPWMIEEQEMGVQYLRMPTYGNATESHSLSGPTRTIATQSTHIAHVVWARYTVTKSYDVFSTSAWTQPQTFQINALSADPYGNTYGEMSGTSAIGPMGTINTKHKWYFRRAWDDTIDTVVRQVMGGGTQHFFYNSQYKDIRPEYKDGTEFFGDFMHTRPGNFERDTFLSDWDYNYQFASQPYWLGGNYSTSQEDALQIQMYITRAGDDIMNLKYFGIFTEFTVGSNGPIRDQGCLGYRTNRHTF